MAENTPYEYTMTEQFQEYQRSAEAHFHLANVWQRKGKIGRAVEGYQTALRLKPDYWQACLQIAKLMLQLGRAHEALIYYEKAFALNPDEIEIRSGYQYLKQLFDNIVETQTPQRNDVSVNRQSFFKDNPQGKINLSSQVMFAHHRSGWQFAINALQSLHNRQGIVFDGCIEHTFGWQHWKNWVNSPEVLEKMKQDGTFELLATTEEKGVVPYTKPWIGCIHDTLEIPDWFAPHASLQRMFAKDIWKRSLPACLGLFTFSEHCAGWLRGRTGKPVSVVMHPTEIPEIQFDFQKFLDNSHKKIIQIGWWLRKLNAIYQLPLDRHNPLQYEKIRILPFYQSNDWRIGLAEKEKIVYNITFERCFVENTRDIMHLPNRDYDQLLSENIAFVYLYDANANNAVIECLARATPILINPLPAVMEYLGEDYPMYFTSLPEAAEKALDTSLIYDTHQYLKNWDVRPKLTAEYFLNSVENSEVYRLI